MRREACLSFCFAALLGAAASLPAAEVGATLRVRVLDPSGAAIPGASVSVEADGDLRDTVTDATGGVELRGLPLGPAVVRAAVPGFEAAERTLGLERGANVVELMLPLARLTEAVAVRPDEDRLSASQGFGSVLTAEEIAALPDDPEELERALREMAGPGAVLRVDGFSGGRLPPKSQIRQIRFRMNPYSAEFHQAGHVAVDVLTNPGAADWRTGLRTGVRDRSLNARPPLAPAAPPDGYKRLSLSLEGPVRKDRTSLALSADGRFTDGARTVLAALPEGPYSALAPSSSHKLDLQARLEHAASPSHALRAEYQRLRHDQDGLAASGLDLPERAYARDQVEHLVRLSDAGSLGKAATETLLELRLSDRAYTPISREPGIQVLGAFAAGGAQVAGGERSASLALTQSFDWGVRHHALRAGFQLEAQRLTSDEALNASGTFTFPSLEAFTARRPSLFSRRSGDPRIELSHVQAGVYVQDDIKLGRKAVLSAGLRNELQTGAGGPLHLAPRLGLAYALGAGTTLRLAGGVFYDWYGAALRAETRRLDGERMAEHLLIDPPYPGPLGEGPGAPAAPNRLRAGDDLELPRGVRASVGIERNLGSGARLRVDYSYERWAGLLRSANLNPPGPDGTRPDPRFGNVLEIVSAGRSRRHTLHLNGVWLRPGGGRSLVLSYVLGHARDDGDGPTSVPATAAGLEGEWGPARTDVRHRLFGFARSDLGGGFSAAAMARYESGAPYDLVTGADGNRDGILGDRPEGTGRHAARGQGRVNVDARLSWSRGFGPPRAPRGPQARVVRLGDGEMPDLAGAPEGRYQLSLYVQAFNLANRTNPLRHSGVLTSPYFGRPLEADPGRRIELGAGFAF